MEFDEIYRLLEAIWLRKRLEDLRLEALERSSGIAVDSIRAGVGGRRLACAVCITDVEMVRQFAAALGVAYEPGRWAEWPDVLLLDWYRLALERWTLQAEPFFSSSSSSCSALGLMVADPDSIMILERWFDLPS